MLMFTLAICCLTTSNLPWFMDLTFQVPMQYCSLQHQSHPQLGVVLLWLHLFILSGVISPLISSSILGTYRPREFIFQCPIFLPFHTVHGVLKARINTEVVCCSLLQWTTFCQTSPPWHIHLGWPHTAWLSFIKLDKAVVHVIRLASCLWLWFQSACPLMPSLSVYHLTWISLTLDVGHLFTAAPAKHSHYSLPWMWGSSPQPLPLTLDMENVFMAAPAKHSSILYFIVYCVSLCFSEHWSACIFLNYCFSRYVPKSGIARSYGSSIFSFIKNFRTILHSACINL